MVWDSETSGALYASSRHDKRPDLCQPLETTDASLPPKIPWVRQYYSAHERHIRHMKNRLQWRRDIQAEQASFLVRSALAEIGIPDTPDGVKALDLDGTLEQDFHDQIIMQLEELTHANRKTQPDVEIEKLAGILKLQRISCEESSPHVKIFWSSTS